MKSTDTFVYYAFGMPCSVHIDSINPDYIHVKHPNGNEDTVLCADFLQTWGGCPTGESDEPSIAAKLYPLHFALCDQRQIHYGEHCNVEIVAQWRERNATHYRVHNSLGGALTYSFEQEGRICRSEHEQWEFAAKMEPAIAAA